MAKYTLKDIRQSTYDRMFLEESEYPEYDVFFPSAFNDACMELCKKFSISREFWINKNATDEDGFEAYDMIDLTLDNDERTFMSFPESCVYKQTEEGIIPYHNYFTTVDQYLYLPKRDSGNFLVIYNAYPLKVTESTPMTYEMEFEPEICQYLPMLCAWRLFLDDDISRATMYYNEYVQSSNENGKPPQMTAGIRIREGYDL